ncbi:restriction endonuclease subunit S [Citrobacter braakii]|uniref:restriction endonuclease subunit S n=1 Tax=Citrobacter braakii TaxID=57706 RepID=UPI001C6961E1|nr:restriction endonuclease subunit S [Citrobacter braakii]QYO50702.1 restriction endonuclease subunit S [Citrobacter braakii]HCQ0108545.1 restriction endonuclease subunit S [Citrobacter braakii]
MAKYKAYPQYKDSGVEWLGEIPLSWDMWKLSHAYEVIGSGTTPTSNNESWFQGNILWVTTGELRETVIYNTSKNISLQTLQSFPALKVHPVGSIIIAMYGATIGRLGILGVDATTNQACCAMTKSNVINNKYLYYWLQTFRMEIINLSSGGGQPNINQEKVASLKISSPSIKDQILIAAFLDHETTKIDNLIEKQQQLIELLKEKRQAVISNAVTKGLNPDVPMKDSGVEWLGEIPMHWKTKAMKNICRIINGSTPKSGVEEFWDGEINWITPTDLSQKSGPFISESIRKITFSGFNSCGTTLVPRDSVIISTRAPIGSLAITSIDSCTNQGCKSLVTNNAGLSKFIYYYLSILSTPLNILGRGSTFLELSTEDLSSVKVPLPDEKINSIISFLDQETTKIDNLLEKQQHIIQLLQERRTALISAAVTGKIDVRNWVAPGEQAKAESPAEAFA